MMTRRKWFTPADERPFEPLGISDGAAATLYADHAGCHPVRPGPQATEWAKQNRAFWEHLRPSEPPRPPLLQRLLHRPAR